MKLGKHSKLLIFNSFYEYGVSKEHALIMYAYLVGGLNQGSFMTSLLANDAQTMLQRSHPSNSITDLKLLAVWLANRGHGIFHGSYQAVNRWVNTPEDERRKILEKMRLIYAEQDEIMMELKDTPSITDWYHILSEHQK